MAVSGDFFKAQATTRYSAARPKLRTGDILLFHSPALGSEVIEIGTRSPWSHAAFIWRLEDIDRVMLLESMDTVGVRAMPMSTRIDGCAAVPTPYHGSLLALRHPDIPEKIDPAKVRAMTQFALDRVGYPYSFQELHQIAYRVALGLVGDVVTGRIKTDNAFICSEYVARCLEAVGAKIQVDKEGFIAPADIANDPKVEFLYSLVPDDPHLLLSSSD